MTVDCRTHFDILVFLPKFWENKPIKYTWVDTIKWLINKYSYQYSLSELADFKNVRK